MGPNLSPEAAAKLKQLQRELPPGTELGSLLRRLDDPASDEASKDRYIGLVAAGAVERALHLAVYGTATQERDEPRSGFGSLINQAAKRGIVTANEAIELHRIREIRNVFAHATGAVSFDTPVISEVSGLLRHHPVSDWAGYFAPIFPPRQKYAIICGEFLKNIMRKAVR